jgi:hypothetical protein
MSHSAVYYIAAESYNDLKAIRSAGIIDAHLVVHGWGVTPPAKFISDCVSAGVSPILNNGNDGVAGWNGSNSYNANLANMGLHAVGGESEQAPEIDSIMDNLIFLDYGGQGTGGGTNNNVWYVTHPAPVHGHGAAGYYETYDASTNLWWWPTLGPGMLNAKAHGVKEIGLMVGNWMMASKFTTKSGVGSVFDHEGYANAIKARSTAQNYVDIANSMEANGITFAGIGIWAGYGSNMNSLLNQFSSWYKLWQSIWPPEARTMKQRYGAAPPPPGPKCFSSTKKEDIMENIEINANEGSSPTPCAVGTKVYVFVQGTDDVLYVKCRTNNVWSDWQSMGGILTSSPGVCTTSEGHIIVTVRGKADANGKAEAWYREYDGKTWSGWQGLGGALQ